jgi:hypothetical protein
MAEMDPLSPLNPAAIAGFGRAALFFQYDPEFRRVTAGGRSENATITRFPVVAALIPVSRRAQLAFSASTYFDRTFSTTVSTETDIGGERIGATERVESRGSVSDVRLAGAWVFSNTFRVGVGGHVLTGENRLVSGRVFADTLRFGTVSDSSNIDYSGIAVSAGAEWRVARGLAVAGSYRKGGTVRTERDAATLTRATAPDRMGVAVRFDRIAGAAFGASYARQSWSNLRGLGSNALRVSDGAEYALGGEVVGPRYGENVVLIRLGARQRDLPFGVGEADVRETAFAGGIGSPLGGGRALVDLSVQRANRSARGGSGALGGASERAWTLSVGFTVRP